MKRIIYIFTLIVLISCGKNKSDLPQLEDLLSDYISNNEDFRLVRDSLIACALGGQTDYLVIEDRPISILFYPEGDATEFQYFETEDINVDPDDLSKYQRKALPQSPIFNGYLHRFERRLKDQNTWGRVTFVKDGNLHISNAIRLKYDDKPTEFNESLLSIDQSKKLSPIFNWEDGQIAENEIYFHVVLDKNGDLISGTYSFDRQFQFYNLSNVVLNIREVTPAPSLLANEQYQFVLMGVSVDNWVNLLISAPFDTNE